MSTFYDIKSGEIITSETLYKEYIENRSENPNEFNYSFIDYIRNCLTAHNGTLEQIN